MIKKAKILMKNGASVDVNVESVNEFKDLANELINCKDFFEISNGCYINGNDISIISYVEENLHE